MGLVENEISPHDQHTGARPDVLTSWREARMIGQALDPCGDEAKNPGRRAPIVGRDCKPYVFEIAFRHREGSPSPAAGPFEPKPCGREGALAVERLNRA